MQATTPLAEAMKGPDLQNLQRSSCIGVTFFQSLHRRGSRADQTNTNIMYKMLTNQEQKS